MRGWGISHTSIKSPPPLPAVFFLGRRFLGRCFLGRRFLGRRFLGRRFLGRRFLGRRFLGRRFLGRHFLGRRFLGRRSSFSRSSFSRHPEWKATSTALQPGHCSTHTETQTCMSHTVTTKHYITLDFLFFVLKDFRSIAAQHYQTLSRMNVPLKGSRKRAICI